MFMMMLSRTRALLTAATISLGCSAGVLAQDKPAVEWGTPGNAIPCDAWEKNEIAEIWTATKPITINGRTMVDLTLSRNAMAVGDTNVWQIVDKACGHPKKE
jgi:hypothetical protein